MASSLPTAEALPRAVLILFIAGYDCAGRRQSGEKTLGLVFWEADGVRGKKLKLGKSLSEHGVGICLLKKMLLQLNRALKFAKYFLPDGPPNLWMRQSDPYQ
jgi:hypothetical protein